MRAIRSLGGVTLVAALCATVGAQNVEGPFGTHNGDIFGRSRLPLVRVNDSGALPLAWNIDLGAVGVNRVAGRAPITFDKDGNIYFRESTPSNSVASFEPVAGALRWRANNGGAGVALGSTFSSSGVVVGDGDLCYALATGTQPAAYGIRKDNGLIVWTTNLNDPPGSLPWAAGTELTPVLFDGKLYVVSQSDGTQVVVYALNAGTGAIEFQGNIPCPYDVVGSLTLVPDLLGGGVHALYWNGSSNSPQNNGGADGIADTWCVRLDTNLNSATLEWGMEGGWVARSHVIYSPLTNRIYLHAWTDFGAEFYTYNAVTGAVVANQNSANNGHGFYDVGCLDWGNQSVVTGAFSGNVVIYADDGTGTTTDVVYSYEPFWGELRVFGQLAKRNATGGGTETILISGTNSRCNDLTEPARVVVLNLDNAVVAEDGPAYFDDILIEEGPGGGPYTTVFSENFNGLSAGDLPGQGGWELDNAAPSGVTPAQLLSDPTSSGQGLVAALDAAGNGGGWQGFFHGFADTTADEVVVTWKQYRTDLTDNLWPYYGDVVNDFAGGWSFEWDQNGKILPYHFVDNGGGVNMAANIWQTISIKFSNINDPDPGNRIVQVTVTDINGSTAGFPILQTDGFNATDSIRGFGFQFEGTPITSGGSANTPEAEYNTGICQDHGFTTRGGAYAGPDGKIYYMDPVPNRLVALGAGDPCFAHGRFDPNGDGVINNFDIDPFVLGLTDLATYTTMFCGGNAQCALCRLDIDESGAINNFDIDPFVACLTAGCD
ncbi:MAG: hypothetical protein AB7Q17_00235 [Phycisphaerae bacterium]